MPDYEERLERIRQKLVRASRLPRRTSSQYLQAKDHANFERFFGADKHQFRLTPTLTGSEIDVWEVEHDTTLPGEYRAFLEKIGNGGVGPKYGLLPLGEWDKGIYLYDELRRKQSARQPCLLVDHPYSRDADEGEWLADILGADWEKIIDGDDWWPTVGTVTLCDYGCGMFEYLILNGPLRGRVFFLNWLDPPVFSPGGFLDWYEDWLDGLLKRDHTSAS